MASSGPDVVNATLGAAFGVAFGGVWALVGKVIEGLEFVCHCQKQCTSLREYLEKIKPMLSKISNECQSEEALENWLGAFQKCVEDANEVLEICTDGSLWDRVREVQYGRRILNLIEKIKENVNISPMAFLTHESLSKTNLGTSLMMQDVPQEILGMEDLFKKVKSKIIETKSTSEMGKCIGIQGMGGAGKTLLAQMVNNNEEIQESFGEDSIFWMTVGRDASVPSLYERMRKYLRVETSCETPLEDQRTHLMNVFSKRRVLLILDDVWDNVHEYKMMIEWLNIAKGSGSVTLVTTRDSSITCRINASVEVLPLLSKEHSWALFCTHAFGTNGIPSNEELMKLAKDVCNECKSLPLALKVIGSAMKSKDDIAEWRSTLRDLRTSNATVHKSVAQQLFDRLRISYDQLDGPIKTCFLYFAAYPEDWEIPAKEFYDMWVIENLFGDDLDAEDALDKARAILNELRRRSLVDDCINYEGDKCVKMHDILRDLAMHMTRKGEEVVRENLFKPGLKSLEQFPSVWLGKPLKVKRLSLVGQSMKRFPNNFIAPQMEICMIGPTQYPCFMSIAGGKFRSASSLSSGVQECVTEEGFFENMANIKYMQLSCSNFKNVPTTIGTLRLLQYLNLSACGMLEKLPESIGGLGSLQHLDISFCITLKELPKGIGGLGSLQHLNMRECVALKKLPESIGGLGSLQHLNMRDCMALKEFSESIGGLGSLQHLTVSGCGALKELPESIGELGSLQYLDMSHCQMLKKLPETIGRLGSLEHLDMSSLMKLKKLPESIGGLGSLQYLDMNGCWLLEKLPESIRGLGSLEYLNICYCKALKELPESIGGLESLQHLFLIHCEALEKLPEGIGGLGSLQDLHISYCKALKELPESVGGMCSLEWLYVDHCDALNELPNFTNILRLHIVC